jgi:putative heme-binding domain-containing protein
VGRTAEVEVTVVLKVTLAAGVMIGAMALGPSAASPGAQDRQAGNPREPDAAPVRAGQGLFRERCAECHGADAKGVQGHDLTRLWASGATDDRVFQTIRSGVPNTIMPSSSAPDAELSALVAYLRSLNDAAPAEATNGNADNGERIFWSACGSCHAIGPRGGHLGPDLSRIGQNQSRDALKQAIREPKASVAGGYQPVTLVTREGQRVRGAKKSEDAFSIQIMDTHEQLQGYLKASLREVIRDTSSLMPPFGPDRLNDRDLDDLLQFLNTLRAAGGTGPGAGRGRGRGGR